MTFSEALSSFFKNYATFSGRARRSEYWYSILAISIISVPLSILSAVIDGTGNVGFFTVLYYAWALAVVTPGLAVVSRRLHDVNKAFGFYFIILVPLVGPILYLVEALKDSQPGQNRFGVPVK
jgi:uncharacterized membrane protein YhaH (DUF805 family)